VLIRCKWTKMFSEQHGEFKHIEFTAFVRRSLCRQLHINENPYYPIIHSTYLASLGLSRSNHARYTNLSRRALVTTYANRPYWRMVIHPVPGGHTYIYIYIVINIQT
jgi:hypothetical protein